MQDEEKQLFHQFSRRCIRVIYALTFGVSLSNSINYLHHFCCREISHARHIVFCRPWRAQFEPLRDALLALSIWAIIGDHQVLEIIEEHWEKAVDRTSLRITVKIIYYLICLKHIPIDDGVAQFEGIEILADSNLFLHHFRSHLTIVGRQREQQFVKFASQSVEVSPNGVGNDLFRLWVDGGSPLPDIRLNERRQISLSHLCFRRAPLSLPFRRQSFFAGQWYRSYGRARGQ